MCREYMLAGKTQVTPFQKCAGESFDYQSTHPFVQGISLGGSVADTGCFSEHGAPAEDHIYQNFSTDFLMRFAILSH
jgi:hypothetical protein